MAQPMKVIGLTGGIAMGKSTAAAQFEALGAKVLSADSVVHGLLGKGGAGVELVREAFPEVYKDGEIDRKKLGAIVFADEADLKKLEGILHPLVIAAQDAQLERWRAEGVHFAVIDIPLLFETGSHTRVDHTVTVSCPRHIQRKRALTRPGMTPAKLASILKRQYSDMTRRSMADFVINTRFGKWYGNYQVKKILEKIQCAK